LEPPFGDLNKMSRNILKKELFLFSALKPNEFERRRALISALCDILWAAGEKKRCCICLLQEDRCYEQDYSIRDDKITEKV
jgi:hypothetical protein